MEKTKIVSETYVIKGCSSCHLCKRVVDILQKQIGFCEAPIEEIKENGNNLGPIYIMHDEYYPEWCPLPLKTEYTYTNEPTRDLKLKRQIRKELKARGFK